MRVAAPAAFSRWMLSSAAWFSWYEKYISTSPLVISAPLTSSTNTTTYLRNSGWRLTGSTPLLTAAPRTGWSGPGLARSSR